MNIIIDKEFEKLIPPLAAEEYDGLEADIVKQGKCIDSLKVWQQNGKNEAILCDGHNRFRICKEHKINDYRVTVMKFKDRREAIVWIIRNQLHRRNLSDFQRTELALRLKEPLSENAKSHHFVQLNKMDKINTRDEVAKQANVSPTTVHRVEKVLNEAPPKIIKAARQGRMSISAAYNTLQKPAARNTALKFGNAFQVTIENIRNANDIRRGKGCVAFKQSDDSQEVIDPNELIQNFKALLKDKGMEILI